MPLLNTFLNINFVQFGTPAVQFYRPLPPKLQLFPTFCIWITPKIKKPTRLQKLDNIDKRTLYNVNLLGYSNIIILEDIVKISFLSSLGPLSPTYM